MICSTLKLYKVVKIKISYDFSFIKQESPEGVKWELGFASVSSWEMGFCALGLGFMKQKQIIIESWEWDFNLSNTGWDCRI